MRKDEEAGQEPEALAVASNPFECSRALFAAVLAEVELRRARQT